MQSKVVFRAARALVDQEIVALRFNFRGTGASQGTHDEGRGERDDVRAALDELAKLYPGLPLVSGGHSFGAIMALRAGIEDGRVGAMFALGLPLARMTDTSFLDRCHKPILFVQGERDDLGSAEAIRAMAARLPDSSSVSIVPSGDHLFNESLDELERIIGAWAARRPWRRDGNRERSEEGEMPAGEEL
jgi:alpha/beta superfamily hydrolase